MQVNLKLLIAEIGGMFAVFALFLFLAAGTLAWIAGWAFLVLFFSFVCAITLWLYRYNPGLLSERMTVSRSDQKTWDKVFFILLQIVFLAWLALMPLDAARWHWSQMPAWLQVGGAIIMVSSFPLFFMVFRENSFLSPMVRIQQDRGQTVVSTGLYHYVRHPMYATALLFLVGTALLLGSWYGLCLELLLIAGIALRAVKEERTLQAELPGYTEYMTQVKYRLIPYLW